ncbi:MAG TPA: amino acid adenylation domain-containing protein, partial [Longimicrobium sp.]|nr:amino acid adenylation domain-containing protein [Longimicrobium sp.]
MTISTLLEKLGAAGVRLRSSGGELKVAGNRAALDAETVGELRAHKAALLELVGGDGEDWWSPAQPTEERGGVPALFEAQAARTPHAPALTFDTETLSYAELNARANRLAHHLQALGVGPDVRVGICLERGVEMVVALLAVLKAGGAYLPLDPEYPEDRLRHMVADARPAVLLTQAAWTARFADADATVVALDADASAWAGLSDENPERPGLAPGHLAYVIYTSGSTGRPKGVMVSHGNLANHTAWQIETFGIDATDTVLQRTSISFDASVWELWTPLACGARMLLLSREVMKDPAEIARAMAEGGVTVAQFVPSLLQALLDGLADDARLSCRTLFCGGEPLPARLVEAVRARGVGEVVNLYGPTETTIDATAFVCPDPLDPARAPSIGRPVRDTRIYVLDPAGEPVPAGVAGELFVGGAGVARGYLDRPALTAERFVPDPFSGELGARLYRTGDLGRRLADRTLEFLGRTDFQVKIRGFRVELGEIEARLAEHPAVREAVVAAREDVPGDTRLVAYYVAGEALEAQALRAHLAAGLPEHMVPAAYVRLDALPLTPNGKLDRKALPAPDGGAFVKRGYQAPVGEMEIALAEIWADVLRLERVGRADDFFDLGGHSLLAVRLTSRVRQVLGVEVVLGDLFNRPVLADFARLLEQSVRADLPAIEPVARGGRLALSFAQQRLWFLEQLGGMGSTYHIPSRLRMQGVLDRAALVRALDRIVARHEALRTTFHLVDGEPEQRVASVETSRFSLAEHDLAGHADPPAELRRVMAEEANAPFDLARGPLIRGRLVRVRDDDHVLLVTMHHVVSDGWSMGTFTRELSALYAAFRDAQPDPLPALAIQYADYAAWQRRWVSGEVLRQQTEYWTRTLAGAPELLALPADRPRPAQQDLAGAAAEVVLDEALTAGLNALSRRHGTTLFMTLLAGWAAVLGRLSGQDDVVIGTPTANRGRAEIEGLIGFFINTLALRLDLSGSPTTAELLGRAKARALEAQQNQDIPFEQVVELVQPARSMAHTPLFQVMFTWQNAPAASLDLPGLILGSVRGESTATAKYDLALTLSESGGRVVGGVVYATALYDAETVERHVAYLRRALEEMVADEHRAVERLALLSNAERRQVVEGWNATDAEPPREPSVHERIEAQVARTPDAPALTFGVETLTYAQLNADANRLAHHLRTLGVGADVRVGLCVERGVEMVVALLAVLKAGGAYLPLDPEYPEDRLRHMVADARPAVLLTQDAWTERFAGTGAFVIALDADAAAWAESSEENPARGGLTADHLAYVIYTSGSTGRPKGVMVSHGSLANHTAWQIEAFAIDARDTVLQRTSISFDASVWELWTPMACGARMLLLPRAVTKDPASIGSAIRDGGVTIAQFVPTLLQAVLDELPEGATLPCRTLFCGGEPLPARLVEAARAAGVGAVVNLYGPTEATIDATSFVCSKSTENGRAPSIGRPIRNTRVYVLDPAGEPVPIGVAGELFVGGAGVARGYLDRPALTAERFIPDAFASTPGARLYRTGDVARWLADGTIEYLGRNDQQVKVRGFRIELGEIESRLAAHAAVREAVVVAREDAPGDTRLVAYYVADEALDAQSLRAHLADGLPEHMLPSAFVALDALPLMPNGKLDRKALPAPEGDAFASRGYVAPVGEMETALAGIWADVLRVDRVGRTDDFFALGGHSLLAVRLTSRVRQVLGADVALGEVFERPVLADFARGVAQAGRAELPPIERADRGEHLALSFAQQRLWFLEQLGGMGSTYHIPTRLRLQGELDRDALGRALERIVARHEALRTTFPVMDGEPGQRITPVDESRVSLAGHDLAAHADPQAEVRRVMAEEAAAPFDLARGPLIRGRLLRLAEDDHVLLVTMHHIVSDGWSMGIFTRELTALYAAFRAGDADPLPALEIQYADYAAWQRRWVSGEVLREQADYWTATLAGAPELLELPADRARPLLQDHAGARATLELDEALTAGLNALSRRHGATLFMTLLAGWAAVLGRLSGQDDVVIGTPTANRSRAEVEGLIGFFLNTLALRLDLSGAPTVGELLGRTRARALEAQQRQDIPFEQVVELVQPARSLAHTPLFQVMLTWQNAPAGALELPGLTLSSGHGDAQVSAKYDLSLTLMEAGGRIAGSMAYATALFDAATVARHLAYLRRALEEMVADDRQQVGRMALLSADERRQVVEAWNDTSDADDPADVCIHHLFEAQAARTPDAVAAVSEGESLTYAEMDGRANQLARHLQHLGVGPEARVAI